MAELLTRQIVYEYQKRLKALPDYGNQDIKERRELRNELQNRLSNRTGATTARFGLAGLPDSPKGRGRRGSFPYTFPMMGASYSQ